MFTKNKLISCQNGNRFLQIIVDYLIVYSVNMCSINIFPCERSFLSDETKLVTNTKRLHSKHAITTLKQGVSSTLLWGFFSTAGPRRPVKVEGNMNAEKYLSVSKLQFRRRFLFQQDNKLKQTAKAPKKGFTDKLNVVDWLSQSPDVNPRAVPAWSHRNPRQHEQLCKKRCRQLADLPAWFDLCNHPNFIDFRYKQKRGKHLREVNTFWSHCTVS